MVFSFMVFFSSTVVKFITGVKWRRSYIRARSIDLNKCSENVKNPLKIRNQGAKLQHSPIKTLKVTRH